MRTICIVPAYNEEKTIKHLVLSAKKYVDEVIVIDDGSKDETYTQAKEAGATVIKHIRNMGKGAALRSGIKEALKRSPDVIITMDGDGQHNPSLIPMFISKVLNENVDIVLGSRFLDKERSEKMPFLRVLSNKTTTFILRNFFGVKTTDSQSGYRAFKSGVFRKITFQCNGYVAESEILIKAAREKMNIMEISIPAIYGGEKSKIKPMKDTLSFIFNIIIKQLISNFKIKISRGKHS